MFAAIVGYVATEYGFQFDCGRIQVTVKAWSGRDVIPTLDQHESRIGIEGDFIAAATMVYVVEKAPYRASGRDV